MHEGFVLRRYAQIQKGFEDPKTNMGYKNTYLLVDPSVLATKQFLSEIECDV